MCHAAVACADMNGPPPGALICQATYCLGADPEAASRLQTPGLSGARLKAHVKQALPNAMSGSAFVLNMQKHAGPGVDILCANFYHDAALVDAGRKHSLTPVSMFLAQLSPKISMPKSGSLLLG